MRFFIFILAISSAFACQAVEGDAILGKDVVAASPLFASLDPKIEIGPAPLAGVRRVLRADDLAKLASRNGISLNQEVAELCFERAAAPLTAEQLLPALRKALAMDEARIEIQDFSRASVPKGEIEFSRATLMPNGMWRGRLIYSQGRTVPIWVKARITTEQTWVEAAEVLEGAKPIAESQLVLKKGPRFPFDAPAITSLDAAAGRRPVRTLASGTAITAAMLLAPHDVERGEKVHVEVLSGGAMLELDATAETAGSAGESIILRNPQSGKRFTAKIQSKGKVLVER